MKSYETNVVPLYGKILEDLVTQWPNIKSDTERDYSYLRRASEERGLEFFTLTLPAYGEWFDKSLAAGFMLGKAEIPRGIKLYRGRPLLFRGVLAMIFGIDGCLRDEADVSAVLYFRTLCQGLKKYEVPPSVSTLRKSVKEFLDVEASLPRPHPRTWDSDVPSFAREVVGHPLWGVARAGDGPEFEFSEPEHAASSLKLNWETLRQLCRRVFSSVGFYDQWGISPRHGPGAVSEKLPGSKYDFAHWPRKLDSVFPFDWYGSASLQPMYVPDDGEPFGRLIAVPKTRKGPRLICAEPAAHQWIQQGLSGWLEERIERTVLGRSISLRDQSKSQRAALDASLSGASATLDLSSASDRLSCRLVEYVFQGSNLLEAFHACRTRAVRQTVAPDLPSLVLLRKFSTMGSALTFPVQSIVFAILTVWALRLTEGREHSWDDWEEDFDRVRVYGDDIIVPVHAAVATKLVLHECGLLVNAAKSFAEGNFRESCGCDAFRGVDVTPARHRKPYNGSAASTAALIQYSNNLFLKGFWKTADWVLGLLPPQERKLLMVVDQTHAGAGIVSFMGQKVDHLPVVHSADYQATYHVRLAFFAKVTRSESQASGRLLQYFTEDPAHRDILEREIEWSPGRPIVARVRKSRVRVYE